jgi:hypothetical protein
MQYSSCPCVLHVSPSSSSLALSLSP